MGYEIRQGRGRGTAKVKFATYKKCSLYLASVAAALPTPITSGPLPLYSLQRNGQWNKSGESIIKRLSIFKWRMKGRCFKLMMSKNKCLVLPQKLTNGTYYTKSKPTEPFRKKASSRFPSWIIVWMYNNVAAAAENQVNCIWWLPHESKIVLSLGSLKEELSCNFHIRLDVTRVVAENRDIFEVKWGRWNQRCEWRSWECFLAIAKSRSFGFYDQKNGIFPSEICCPPNGYKYAIALSSICFL